MEESLNLIKADFISFKDDPLQLSPLILAYIGDAVYELIIRSFVINKGNKPVNKLHKDSASLVNAKTQAEFINLLKDYLTEEELRIYKRGRNTTSHSVAKNASVSDYRQATGFEALIGYLYLCNKTDRISELIAVCISYIKEENYE